MRSGGKFLCLLVWIYWLLLYSVGGHWLVIGVLLSFFMTLMDFWSFIELSCSIWVVFVGFFFFLLLKVKSILRIYIGSSTHRYFQHFLGETKTIFSVQFCGTSRSLKPKLGWCRSGASLLVSTNNDLTVISETNMILDSFIYKKKK